MSKQPPSPGADPGTAVVNVREEDYLNRSLIAASLR